MLTPFSVYLYPVLLLIGSNVFMTFAWYGHLKYKSVSLVTVIFVSWGIAFFEYCLQVPGNRLGSVVYSAPQLEGYAGGNYSFDIRLFLNILFGSATTLESLGSVWPYFDRGSIDVQGVRVMG